ncbi:MAG: alpha/beta hydrolase-fold protein [Gemmatimonadales bacterium]|nr:alpha/beta hydrolase-fold protein [Gemmatimonadales bacterium]
MSNSRADRRAPPPRVGSVVAVLCLASAGPVCGQAPPILVADGRAALGPAAEAQVFRITSRILGEERRVRVVLPPSFPRTGAGRRYPVIIAFDGESLTRIVQAAGAELARNGQIPEAVIVGIDNTGPTRGLDADAKRVFDLTPPGLSLSGSDRNQGGDRMLDFVEGELLPAVDRGFRAGLPRVLIGHSSGAVLVTHAVATRSGLRAAVALDPPVGLQDGWLANRLIERAGAGGPGVRYVAYGARFGWPDEMWNALVAKAPASWRIGRQALPSESHETMPFLGTYLGLREVFADYSRLASPNASADSVLRYYGAVGQSLGAAVVPPRRALDRALDRAMSDGAFESARAVIAAIVAGYGRSADTEALERRVLAATQAPRPAETVASLLATPFPTPDQARRVIGQWAGDVWMGTERPSGNATRLEIRVENGRIVGETVRQGPDGRPVVRRWEYLRITPTGMTWGFLNGMEPRGVALFEGTLNGDALTGSMRLAGLPPGTDAGPQLQFAFTRVRP